MSVPRQKSLSGLRWACPDPTAPAAGFGHEPALTLPVDLPGSRWPAAWQRLHRPDWLLSVWQRLQHLLHHPLSTRRKGLGRTHLVLGILRLEEQRGGQLELSRWRRSHRGMGWEAVPHHEVDVSLLAHPEHGAWAADQGDPVAELGRQCEG
jgi:hypothetical protein